MKTTKVNQFVAIVLVSLLMASCSSSQDSAQPDISQAKPLPTATLPVVLPTVGHTPFLEATATQEELTEADVTSTPAVDDPWSGVDPRGQQIIFWHIFSEEREQALVRIVNEFNSSNPYHIQVLAANQGSYVDIFNKMLEVRGAQDAPDILIAYQNQAAIYQLSNDLIDLTSLIESPTWGFSESERQMFFPGIWQQDIYPSLGNQRLGVPFYRSIDMLYYNVDWLEKLGYAGPPSTPDAFSEMACAAVRIPFVIKDNDISYGALFFTDASRLASWVFSLGGDIYDLTGGYFTLNNEIVKGVLSFQRNLITSGCAMVSPSWDYDQEQFIQGKVMAIMASSNLISYFTELQKTGDLNFRWGASAYPHLTPAPVSNSYGPSISIADTTPEKELAAFLFLKHMVSIESQVSWAIATGTLPVRSDMDDALSGWFIDFPHYRTAYSLLWNTKNEPALPGYDFVRKEIEDATSAILEGGDVDAILDILNTKANEIIANQGVQ